MNKALLDLEDTVIINDTIDLKVNHLIKGIHQRYDNDILDIKDNIRKIWSENLSVPEVIKSLDEGGKDGGKEGGKDGGKEGTKYQNFRAY